MLPDAEYTLRDFAEILADERRLHRFVRTTFHEIGNGIAYASGTVVVEKLKDVHGVPSFSVGRGIEVFPISGCPPKDEVRTFEFYPNTFYPSGSSANDFRVAQAKAQYFARYSARRDVALRLEELGKEAKAKGVSLFVNKKVSTVDNT